MATDIILPEIGEGVTEGELVQWLVKVGDSVSEDQPVAEVMTDKATVEVPTPKAGTIKELKFAEGDVIEVESVILLLEEGAGAPATAAPAKETPSAAPTPAAAKPAPPIANGGGMTTAIDPPVAASSVLATPSTRRLAREMSVDINGINGSGLAGRVTREDVLQSNGASSTTVSPSKQAPPALTPFTGGQESEERVPLRGIRKKIAENMQMSKRVIPHFTLMDDANVTSLVELRTSLKPIAEREGTKITYLPFVIKALIQTAKSFPMFNGSIDDEASEIVYKKHFHIGFAADTPNGLLVPVIKFADQKSLLDLSREIIDLAGRARQGKLRPDEMKGATMTITNIGSVGGNYATPIINHPEVAILGMYKISDKPLWTGSDWKNSKSMNFTITADHRLIDGAVAANFLAQFIEQIENPGALMLNLK